MKKRLLAATAILAAALHGAANSESVSNDATSLRTYTGVNDTTIQCPPVTPRSAAQLAAQFETRPRDLDEMSVMAARFMDPNSDNPGAVAFRVRQAEQRATDWPFFCRYRDANAALMEAGVRPNVVFMGDSITEGWIEANPEFFARNGYVDRGISGQSSTQMVARFYADAIALRPKVVHIMTGTNDIGGATGAITEDEYIYNVTAMLDIARANSVTVVLASIPPMSRLLPRPEFDVRPVVLSMNERLRQLAEERSVAFIDYYTPLADGAGAFDPRYANDGVHPTRAGYAVMEPLARAALSAALSQ